MFFVCFFTASYGEEAQTLIFRAQLRPRGNFFGLAFFQELLKPHFCAHFFFKSATSVTYRVQLCIVHFYFPNCLLQFYS